MRKNLSTSKKKLRLSTETLRQLASGELAIVVGGAQATGSVQQTECNCQTLYCR